MFGVGFQSLSGNLTKTIVELMDPDVVAERSKTLVQIQVAISPLQTHVQILLGHELVLKKCLK